MGNWPIRPPVAACPALTVEQYGKLRAEHRPYQATAGILCLACSMPNVTNDRMAPVVTFHPCVFARLFEYVDTLTQEAKSDA